MRRRIRPGLGRHVSGKGTSLTPDSPQKALTGPCISLATNYTEILVRHVPLPSPRLLCLASSDLAQLPHSAFADVSFPPGMSHVARALI
jgi:hypothetical protein